MAANYKQPKDCNRRVRFYDGQYLQDQDFIDEQKYHFDRQQRHQHTLHVSGIATGLIVTPVNADEVKVSPGTAIDQAGRSIVLETEQTISVPADGWLYVAYHQVPAEKQAAGQGIQDDTRWIETPCFFIARQYLDEADPYDPDDSEQLVWKSVDSWKWVDYLESGPPPILLAKLSLGGETVAVDPGDRRYSGLRLPAPNDKGAVLRADATGAISLWTAEAGELSPRLSITEAGNVGIGTPSPQSPLAVSGGAAIGSGYADQKAPENGLVVEGSIGIGTTSPQNPLSVSGGAAIGAAYAKTETAPANGLIVQGSIGIGTTSPQNPLSVAGGAAIGADYTIQSAPANGLIVQGNLGLGTASPQSPLSVSGGAAIGADFANTEPAPANGLIVQGNLGVGTTDPQQKLVVESQHNAGKDPQSGMDMGGSLAIKSNAPQLDFIDTDDTDDTDHNDWSIHVNSNKMYFVREPWNYTDLVLDGAGNVGIRTADPQAELDVAGVVRAETFASTNPLRHRMYPDDPLVYQDIFEARDAGAIVKLGNYPAYNDTTWPPGAPWNDDRPIIMYGNNNEADGNGAEVTIPEGYDTVWVRVLGERWNVIKAYFLDGSSDELGLWAGGRRSNNCYCPDGSLSDGYSASGEFPPHYHQWLPIPAGRAGKLALVAKPHTDRQFWLSGLAFSKNPWAHAAQSAVAYHWALNGGTAVIDHDADWYLDVLAVIAPKNNYTLMVPVVPSGRDKLLYLIEHNNYWNGCMHTGITVNDQPIERFTATYDNPFARHWNSKWYQRYIAARIPADMIPANTRYISVQINMDHQGAKGIYFREIGTHDLDIPTNWA